MQVQQFGTFHILDGAEYANQLFDVVSVEWTEVADIHAVKDVLLMGNGTLDGVRQALDAFLAVIIHQSLAMQPPCGLELDGIIGLVRIQS